MSITFSIITVSDTCFRKEKTDAAGPKLEEEILKAYPQGKIAHRTIVPDEIVQIKSKLLEFVHDNSNVILTVGGTGFSPRDNTPEATKQVIQREANGLNYAMLSKSLQVTDFAMLSRGVCGICDNSIIINLPGSTKGATECWGFIQKPLKHAVDLLLDKSNDVVNTHKQVQLQKSKVTLNAAERPRSSKFPMLEMDLAVQTVINECKPTNIRMEVSVPDSLGRVLCDDIYSKEPIPPFDASIKDGYAVMASDGVGVRKVRSVTAAGDSPVSIPLKSGEIIRISTGAPVPLGADAVVQVEDTELTTTIGHEELEVNIKVPPKVGQDIRKTGSDIQTNTLVITAGTRITAAHLGVLTMLGHTKVFVYKQANIGIISTGNELCVAGEDLKPGQIRDSNKLTLINLLKEHGYNANDCGIAKDTPDDVFTTLCKAFQKNDIVVTTGGVSMGEFDVIKQVLKEDFDATVHFGRINMKPGKPTTFATLDFQGQRKYMFGLPGNPVSCGVTCLLFVIPSLKYLENSTIYNFPITKCTIKDNIKNNDVRPEYVRVVITYRNGNLEAQSTGNQISSRLNSLLGANGLLILPGNTQNASGKNFDTVVVSNINFAV